MNIKAHQTKIIKSEASRLGFMYCSIAKAQFLDKEAPLLEKWLRSKMHGEMAYMGKNFDKRLDPRLLVDGAKSVVSLLLNYFPAREQEDPEAPKLSKYAFGKDYYFVIKDKLKQLLAFIRSNIGQVNGAAFVDSAAVMDKVWAKMSGAGWIGKNTNLIRKNSGSFFFIAGLILDLELEYDAPVNDYCGTCTRCIDECPTGAIIEPYLVDGSRCISYFTIEIKGKISEEYRGKFQNMAFGCDICQDVCPWNRFSTPHDEPAFFPHEKLLKMSREEWTNITKDVFDEVFRHSAVKRAKFNGLKRNIRFITEHDEAPSADNNPAKQPYYKVM